MNLETIEGQIAASKAYSMQAYAQFLRKLELPEDMRELIRYAIALAYLEGGKAFIKELQESLR